MLKNFIGEENFKKSIQRYIETYKEKTVKTEEFQEVCEKICGLNLKQFFHQWLFTAGHPELDIQFQLEYKKINKNTRKKQLKIKITQKQRDDSIFIFPLEIRVVYNKAEYNESVMDKIERIEVNEKITEYTFDEEITDNTIIELISIDPELKILKEIKSLTIDKQNKKFNLYDILENSLKKEDETTTIV
jgi:aminopeptidase N